MNCRKSIFKFLGIAAVCAASAACSVDDADDLAELLLADKHVAVVPGNAFEAEGFCRLSYAVAMESCMEGLRRIEEFVSELK